MPKQLRHKSRTISKLGIKLALLASVCGTIPAINVAAQTAQGAQSKSYDEIIVTARKRAQSLQDFTGSISAIAGDDLAKTQVTGFDDYSRLVPSLNALNSGGGQTQISMRGVFPSRFNHAQPQNRSTTGLYLEDIPITTSAFNPDAGLIDINRIEVLRGPQGTLYGASAMSGAIRIIPNAPSTEAFEGSISSAVELTKDGGTSYNFNGVLNVPLSDKAALRGVGYFIEKAGFIDNVFTGEEDYNDETSFGGRLTGKFDLSEAFTVTAMGLYHNLEAGGRPDEYVPGNPLNSTGLNGGASIIGPTETADQFNITDELQIIRLVDDSFDDEYFIGGLTANYDMDSVSITSVTSYFTRSFNNSLDDNQRSRDALGAASAECYINGFTDPSCQSATSEFTNNSDFQQFTQELRLSSLGDGPLQWVIGGFYSDESREFVQNNPFNDEDGNPELVNVIEVFGFGPSTGLDFGGDNNNIFSGNQAIDTTQIAAFGEATYEFGALEVTAGLRWFNYDQDVDILFAGLANDGITTIVSNQSESGVNPNFAIKYEASENVNLYATAAKGFRIGGVNDPIPLSGVFGSDCAADLQTLGLTALPERFESDELWSYEAGVKATLAGGRVKMNAAAYYIDWQDVQTQAFLPCGFQTITNDADIVSKGFEVELAGHLSDNFTLQGSLSYTDSSLSSDSVILSAQEGDRTPYVPQWLFSMGFDYTRPVNFVNESSEFFIKGDIQHTGSSFSEFSPTFPVPRTELPAHSSINLFTGILFNQVELGLYVRNLTNERIVTGVDLDRRQPTTFTRARPRTVGVSAKYNF